MLITDHKWIAEQLIHRGKELFDAPREFIQFAKHEEADRLLNDLEQYPHAFVLACAMNRQMKAEKAGIIPYRFQQRLNGDFSIDRLAALSIDDVREFMSTPVPLHRFLENMSVVFHAAVRRIVDHYEGDASRIWRGTPSSADVVYNFLEFDGVGQKIASLAANILARDFKIPFADYYSIDVSADIHVRRVFGRLGLTDVDPTVDQCIFRARAIKPEFPGLMDLSSWEIGRNWCKKTDPQCYLCYMRDGCRTAKMVTEGTDQ
jgi:endonuclease III